LHGRAPEKAVSVVLVEDSAADARLTTEMLRSVRPTLKVTTYSRVEDAAAALPSIEADCVLLDLGLPGLAGLEALDRIAGAARGTPIVVLTGRDDDRLALEAMRRGAQDYVTKRGLDGATIWRAIARAIERQRLVPATILDIGEQELAESARAQLAAIVESSDDAVIGMTLEGKIVSWNRGAERMYGWLAREVIGAQISLLCPDGREDEMTAVLERLSRGERVNHYETVQRHRAGREIEVSLTVSSVVDAAGRVVGASTIARDISERRRAENAIRDAEETFRRAFDEAPIGMAMLDLEGRFIQVNGVLCAITGIPREQLESTSLAAITHPEDAGAHERGIAGLISGAVAGYRHETRLVHAGQRPVWVALQVALLRDADGNPLRCLAQIQDITERHRYEERLRYLADHDPLTGLPNRRGFEQRLEMHAALSERYGGGGGAALVLDLDHFKFINDTLGHTAGDQAIIRAANVLRSRLRETDVLTRLGGDEFAIFLPHADGRVASLVAEQLLAALRSERVDLGGSERSLAASAGIALFDAGRELSAEDVLVNADAAMYDAKNAGRDRAELYQGGKPRGSRMKGRITWAKRIGKALKDDEFTLLEQPVVELATGRVSQCELLLRMRDESGDLVPPSSFLDAAERLGMVQEIDRWVTKQAIASLAVAGARGEELTLEVNLSGSSIGDAELLALIGRELERTGVAPARLGFEVTEAAVVVHMARAGKFARDLARLGCRFGLDDFGAAYGSLYYLKHLPFDFLKIDGEFVKGCPTNETDRLLIKAVVDIATGMGMRTIAECVDHDETVEVLKDLGVGFGQGYHLGRPTPARLIGPVA